MSKSPQETLGQLLANTKTLQIATLDAAGEPAISYAPFVQDGGGNFYIFVSGLSSHTQEIIQHPRVSVLLVEDEQDARQIFARTRATYHCEAVVVGRDDGVFPQMLDALEERFGNVVGLLRGLGDFVLFRLKPVSGRFVMGFGQAFVLAGEGLREFGHIGPDQLQKG
ncbi:MAG: pyridoxamine 5'-phosphate oxidase family protein [Gammaproteobacteria bacterium]|nr:pyridoxamine 5'-phosphate oxidase family protein [Gammaproteobacteria bacterium]MBU1723262.1 pyridoxamine 5'-phosphate oxidase family protein [Gammaproteobacteria bacterium]MBU2003857.1 pyridoxamine 5'-phosphate oxidase family protein [Gammaproteobacteria bacterium]